MGWEGSSSENGRRLGWQRSGGAREKSLGYPPSKWSQGYPSVGTIEALPSISSEIRGHLGLGGRRGRSFRQVEHVARQAVEERKHLGRLHHVGIFSVHVAEIDGVARL